VVTGIYDRYPVGLQPVTKRERGMVQIARGVLLAVAVLALALLHDPASAQARSGGAMPFVNQGGCPSGYYTSGSFCAPLNKDSRPAVPKPPVAIRLL
jgi:hypothetical protein